MSFDIVIQYIKSFSGIYLPFKNDVIAVQPVVDNYLILWKVFLEKDQFRDARPFVQIKAGSLKLDHLAYLPAFTKGIVIGIFIHLCNRYYQGMC